MPLHEPFRIELTASEWKKFRLALGQEIHKAATQRRTSPSELRRLSHSADCLNYLTRDQIETALKAIRHGLPEE